MGAGMFLSRRTGGGLHDVFGTNCTGDVQLSPDWLSDLVGVARVENRVKVVEIIAAQNNHGGEEWRGSDS